MNPFDFALPSLLALYCFTVMHLLNLLRHCVCQVEITVLNSKSSGIVFLGAPYSFYTVDGVPVNYSIGSVTAFDLQYGRITNITYRIVSSNFSCT